MHESPQVTEKNLFILFFFRGSCKLVTIRLEFLSGRLRNWEFTSISSMWRHILSIRKLSSHLIIRNRAVVMRRSLLVVMGMILLSGWGSFAQAQSDWLRPGVRAVYYNPMTAVAAQIHAEADMYRAYGDVAVDFAVAEQIRARTARLEIENSVEAVKAYWERRSIGEAERLKRHKTLAQKQEIRNSHLWKRLKDHPELSSEAIRNGTALNFLLDRLAGGVLAYNFSPGQSGLSMELLNQLTIDPETLHQLRVRQDPLSGGKTVFRLDEGKPLDLGWWPSSLRIKELKEERTEFENARTTLLKSSQEELDDNLQKLFEAYNKLLDAFTNQYPRSVRLKSVYDHTEFGRARRFLQSLLGELQRIQSVGPKAIQNDSLRFEGKNLIALLTHMSRNGLEFAEPVSGDEAAYHRVFHMMRDLYVTVADDEQSDDNQTGTGKTR